MNNSLRLLILFSCFIILTHPAFGQIPELKGKTDCAWGSDDCNPCVKDVVGSFNRLRVNGDVLGFNLGAYPNPSLTDHWQGIQRIMVDEGQFLVVSRLNSVDGHADFAVVAIDSQGHDDKRLRSNRLEWHTDINNTAPPAPDMIFHEEVIDEPLDHAGGIQMLGKILAVPLEDSSVWPPKHSEVRFFDMKYPTNPQPIGAQVYRDDPNAASVSMAQLDDGNYLLIVGGDTKPLDFYISVAPQTLSFQEFARWERSPDFKVYQNIDLVTDCNEGDLYLIGTYNNDSWWGENWAELFSLRNGEGGSIEIGKVSSLHLDCEYRDGEQCNFRAAAGTYVDSKGQLYLYSTEGFNGGPNDSIRMMEFRPVPHDTCEDINKAWVEVYQYINFLGRGLMIDYVDRNKEDYANYTEIDDFNDKTSSVRWCLPSGWNYELWENTNLGGARLLLQGNGTFQEYSDLNGWSFDNMTSSSRWVQAPQSFSLNVNKTGDGDGRVLSDPTGINCGLYCQANFLSGTVVELTVTDFVGGSRFIGWQGDCSGTECQLRMDGNKNVTAEFAPEIKYRLTVTKSGVGTGTVTSNPAGINCGADCSEDYSNGTSVALTADAAEGSKFVSWSGSCTGSNPTCRVLMDQVRFTIANFDVYVPANFTDDPIQPRVTVVKELHIHELRDAINNLRISNGLGLFNFTDPILERGDRVGSIHIRDLRDALNAVYDKLGRARPTYTDPSLPEGTRIKADHINQLRAAVRAVE